MLLKLEPPRFGNIVLAAFNLGIHELLDAAAVEADQVVVVLARVKLINRLSRLEVTAQQQTGLLEKPSRLTELRKTVAKIETVMSERRLGLKTSATPAPAKKTTTKKAAATE